MSDRSGILLGAVAVAGLFYLSQRNPAIPTTSPFLPTAPVLKMQGVCPNIEAIGRNVSGENFYTELSAALDNLASSKYPKGSMLVYTLTEVGEDGVKGWIIPGVRGQMDVRYLSASVQPCPGNWRVYEKIQ